MTGPADLAGVVGCAVSVEQLAQVTADVWSAVLDRRLHRRRGPIEPPAGALTGRVTILGAWRGSVGLAVSPQHAREVAAAMFDTDPATVSDDDLADALGELTNMVSGRVKTLLPAPSVLSLPSVIVEEADRLLAPLVRQVLLGSGSELVRVSLRHSPPLPPGERRADSHR